MKAVDLALVLASIGFSGCGAGSGSSDSGSQLTPTDTCFAGCLCYRTPEQCRADTDCHLSYAASVDGSAPDSFCANGPPPDASAQ
jgi:hypothetical protein